MIIQFVAGFPAKNSPDHLPGCFCVCLGGWDFPQKPPFWCKGAGLAMMAQPLEASVAGELNRRPAGRAVERLLSAEPEQFLE